MVQRALRMRGGGRIQVHAWRCRSERVSAELLRVVGFLASASTAHAIWVGIYEFEKNGTAYDVVTTDAGDSLDDLFLNGYDGLDFSGFGSIGQVLDVGTLSSTASLQDHLVRAMLGLSGYGSLSNPGTIRIAYETDWDYRYLEQSANSGIVEDAFIDTAAVVPASLGYVIHRGSEAAIPEPNTALLLALGMAVFAARARARGRR